MSKKKSKLEEKIFKEIMKMFGNESSNLSNEQEEMIRDIISGKIDLGEMTDELWHDQNLPNYASISRPIAGWLQPLACFSHMDEISTLCTEALKAAEKMPRSQVVEDLQNFIYAYLAFLYDDDLDTFDNSNNIKSLYAAFWLISKLQLTELIDTVLETLRQPYDIVDHMYFSRVDTTGSAILHEIGKGQMDKLTAFLNTQGVIPMVKTIVFDALALTYKFDPELRLQAINHLNNYLKKCLDIGLAGGDISNISHYAYTLASVHAKETLPMLKRIYHLLDVPPIEIDGISDVEIIMNDNFRGIPYYLPLTMDDILRALADFGDTEDDEDWDEEEDEEWDEEDEEDEEDWDDEDDEDWDEEDEEEDDGYGYISLYNDDLDMEKYKITITLEDTRHKVERQLQIPSNIYLDCLSSVIQTAMEWEEIPDMAWFEAHLTKYIDLFDKEHFKRQKVDDIFEHVASDLLPHQHDRAFFFIKEGDLTWTCKIQLTQISIYDDDEYPLVKLLDAKGPFPLWFMKSKEEYEDRYARGELEEPDIDAINEELELIEEENT